MPKSYDEYEGKSRHSGISGYDPEEPEMRGVFMARGPGIYFVEVICTTSSHIDQLFFRILV